MDNMMIKEAAKRMGVEAHVLRYWEDELGLEIKRNAMGHRYYDERDLQMFQMVKDLKENGLALKDIKSAIDKQRERLNQEAQLLEAHNSNSMGEIKEGKEEDSFYKSGDKKRALEKARKNNEDNLKTNINKVKTSSSGENGTLQKAKEANDNVLDVKIVDFKQAQLQSVMNKVVANALRENREIITTSIKEEITADVMRQFDTVMREKEEKEEERFKKLDEYLRQLQHLNLEVAATKTKRRFGRRK